MKTTSRVRIALLSAIFIVGCSTMKDRAKESLDSGNYESALHDYEQLASRHPDDPEAVEGLKKARGGYLAQKLIEVRKARMSGNLDGALGILLDVNQKEDAWKVMPSMNAGFTQSEELESAWPPFKARVLQDIQEKKPLRSELFLRKYETVFGSRYAKDYSALHTKVLMSGKERCHEFKKASARNLPFYAIFTGRFCQFWGEPGAESGPAGQALYGSLRLNVTGKDIPLELQGELKSTVEKSFTQSAWYDPRGQKTMTADVQAEFSNHADKSALVLEKAYQEDEHYVNREQVKKTRQVPYTYQEHQDPKNPNSPLVNRYGTRSEDFYVEEPVEHVRKVDRSFRYPAWNHTQDLAMTELGTFHVENKTFDVSQSDKNHSEGVEHNEDRADIDLHPSRPNLTDQSAWIRGEIAQFSASFLSKAQNLWRDSYCAPDASATSLGQTGEQVMRCSRGVGLSSAPGFVSEWYGSYLGVDPNTAESALAKK